MRARTSSAMPERSVPSMTVAGEAAAAGDEEEAPPKARRTEEKAFVDDDVEDWFL